MASRNVTIKAGNLALRHVNQYVVNKATGVLHRIIKIEFISHGRVYVHTDREKIFVFSNTDKVVIAYRNF